MFKDYLKEDEEASSSSVNSTTNIDTTNVPIGMVQRINMPQVMDSLYNDFKSDLDSNNVNHEIKKVDPISLQASQDISTIYADKINSLRKNKDKSTSPILISSDNYIVDGHHRWASCEDNLIDVHQVNMPFKDLYDFLIQKPYVVRTK